VCLPIPVPDLSDSAEAWKDFFVTAASASATLVGLVMVAISVNVQQILEQPQLPSRGGAAAGALMLILASCSRVG
jgi:hypothetical protein